MISSDPFIVMVQDWNPSFQLLLVCHVTISAVCPNSVALTFLE